MMKTFYHGLSYMIRGKTGIEIPISEVLPNGLFYFGVVWNSNAPMRCQRVSLISKIEDYIIPKMKLPDNVILCRIHGSVSLFVLPKDTIVIIKNV